jgi:UDP-glucuronate 4-epimerase
LHKPIQANGSIEHKSTATYADVTDLDSAVGFEPSTPIEEGVKRFMEWYRNFYRV